MLVVALQLSFALGSAPGAVSDYGFLPGLVAGAGAAGLLLRLGARDAASLDGELARARERSAAARAAAIAAERRRLEHELLAITERSLAELRRLVAAGARQAPRPPAASAGASDAESAAFQRTLAAIETTAAAALADLGRLAAVLRGG